MPELAWWQWLLGAFCAMNIGIAKTGLPGVGMIAIPLMVIAVGDARQSAGWLLPILLTADVFAILYWGRHTHAGRLFGLAPWVVAGIVLGSAALSLSESVLRPMVGIIILAMLALHFWRRYQTSRGGVVLTHSAPYGLAAGFSTTVANAAGPVMNMYLLSKRLTKEEFVATGAWFFFVVNLSKLPIYTWHGLISRESLAFNLCMAPAVAVGAVTGRWALHRVSPEVFEVMVVVLTVAATLLLFR